MAKDNEAKVKISGDVEELKQAFNDAQKHFQTLRSEAALIEAQFKNTGDKAKYLEDMHKNLAAQIEENTNKQESLRKQLELAIQAEDSENVEKLTQKLNRQEMQGENLARQMRELETEIKNNNSASGQLSNTIDEQSAKLNELKNEYTNVVLEQGKNSDEAKRLAGEISNLSTELKSNKDELEKAKSGADELDKSLEKTGDNGLNSMDTLAQGIIALGLADMIKDIANEISDTAKILDEANSTIVQGTGATGDSLKSLNESAREVYKNMKNANADMSDVSGVVAELNTRLGSMDGELVDLSDKVLKFSKVTGMDAVDSVDSIVDIIKRWDLDIESTDDLLDNLVTTNQACSLSIDEITGYLIKNKTQFEELGYNLDESLALITAIADSGGDVSSVMGGMQKAVSKLAEKTNDVPGAFEQAIAAMQSCNDVSSALQAKVGSTGLTIEDVFGKRAAQEIATTFINGGGNIDDFLAKLRENDNALNTTAENSETMADRYSQSTNNLNETLSAEFLPVLSEVYDIISNSINFLAEHNGILISIGIVIGTITGILLIYNAVKMISTGIEIAHSVALWAVAAAQAAANAPLFAVIAIIAAVIAIIVICIKHWDGIKNAVTNAVNKIKDKVTDMKNSVSEKIEGLKEKISSISYAIKSIVVGVINSIISGVENGVNRVIRGINTMINGFNKIIGIGGAVLGIDVQIPNIKEISLPRVALAEGGIAFSPVQALIGEGGEPEAVAPISVLQRYIENSVESKLNTYMMIDYTRLAESMSAMQTIIELNSREVGRAIRS